MAVLGTHAVAADTVGEDAPPRTTVGMGPREPAPVHRLQDLSPGGRVVAALMAGGLVSVQVVAVLHFAHDWAPGGDVALMGVRSLDVFSSRLPLLGQPSTSGLYGGFQRHAFHPGPLQFYMMAPLVKVLGSTAGMLVTAVLITVTSVLVAAWAVFRQLGGYAGVVGAVVIGLVMFTTGMSSLVNPISSNIAGYPLLCGAVLVYGLLCGDDRLLPAAVCALSFAGQAHLSVGLGVALLLLVGLVAVAVNWWQAGIRHDPALRRHAWRWGGTSVALGLALAAPVFFQQVHGHPGNLTALARFASDSQRPALGVGGAVRQVAHALGLPPVLGRTQLGGFDLIDPVGLDTWLSAGLVLAVLAVAGVRWRDHHPRRSRLVVMVGVLLVCCLVNGASVPDSVEQGRLAFYHWVWPLTVLVVVGLALVVADVARRLSGSGLTRPLRAGLVALALAAIVVPAVVNPALDRRTNYWRLTGTTYPRAVYTGLVDQALDAGVGDVDGQVVIVSRGGGIFDGAAEGLALQLMEHGVDMGFPQYDRDFVADEHLAQPDDLGAVLMLVSEGVDGPPPGMQGREVARVDVAPDFDRDAYRELVRAVEGVRPDEIVPGPEYRRFYDGLHGGTRDAFDATIAAIFEAPDDWFANQQAVQFFIDYPVRRPHLDPEALQRLRDSFPPGFENGPPAVRLSLWMVTGDEAARALPRADGRPPSRMTEGNGDGPTEIGG